MESPGETKIEKEPQKKRIIVVLSSRIEKRQGGFVFPLFLPDQENPQKSVPYGVSGGFSRMRATQSESQKVEASATPTLFLVTGGIVSLTQKHDDTRSNIGEHSEAERSLRTGNALKKTIFWLLGFRWFY